MTDHPITPPPELVREWAKTCSPYDVPADHIATQAARWGADQELEACCKWLPKLPPWSADDLRKHRRSKPPSLKERALATLQKLSTSDYPCNYQGDDDWDAIRRALEQLDD